jgi:hypothetical protein
VGTYDASLIRVAGKKHECGDCMGVILKGSRYLAYKPGLHSTHKVCMACALRLHRDTCAPLYRCRAVEDEIADRAKRCNCGSMFPSRIHLQTCSSLQNEVAK